MTYNSIMVQLDIDAPISPRLTFARDLARRFQSDLTVFAAAEPVLVMSGDMEGSAAAEAIRSQIEDIEERLKAMKDELDTLTRGDSRISWREAVGDPTRFLAYYARAADLLVVGPSGTSGGRRSRTIEPGELILSAGRPVLFAGEDYRPVTAENILVGWKDTREARRAVVDAMPFLAGARQVLVATIEEDDLGAARESAADVVGFLMKHSVKAHSEVLDAGRSDTSEALLEAATRIGADLTVSGGYGHSRLREWVFGGVTRSLLKERPLNRLIAN